MGLLLGAAGMLCCLAGFEVKAGEPRRQKAMNGEEFPIRITLVSSTNTTAVPSNNAARIHQSALQWSIESSIEGRRFGRSLAVADINGDGFPDLFIGQPRGATTRNPGAIFVYYGAEAGLFSASPTVVEGVRPRDMFGLAMANASDVNGDGLADVVIGAPEYSNGETQEGAFFLMYGRSDRKPLRPDFHLESDVPRFQLALSVAAAGDVNGDGISDVLVGAPRHPVKSFQQGAAYLYAGSPTGLISRAVWAYYSDQREAHCGQAVACAGDVNHDGYSDVLVGMPDFDSSQPDVGRVLLFLGSKSGLKDTPDWTADGPHAHGRFGATLATAGDLNRDGFDDVLIGSPGIGDEVKLSVRLSGWVFAYFGSSNGLAKSPAWAVSDGQDGAQFGSAIAALGDINGDRYLDVVIGAPGFDGRHANQGRVCLFLGTKGGLLTTPDWTLEGNQAGAECGGSVAAASDINRDGLNDFMVATPAYSTFRAREGRVDIFLGSRTGYQRRNEFPVDGTNSVALPRQAFKPPTLAEAVQTPPLPFAIIYLGGGGLILALGVGLIFWRRKSRAALETGRFEERARIARDLHDEVGSQLIRLDKIGGGDQNESQGMDGPPGSTASQDIARALERAVWAIDPTQDTLESLVSFLGEQGERFFAGTNIYCRFDLPEILTEKLLRVDVRKSAILCVQEAFANALKHSGASEVWLRVKHETRWLTIWVEDNGRGLPCPGLVRRRLRRRRSRRALASKWIGLELRADYLNGAQFRFENGGFATG